MNCGCGMLDDNMGNPDNLTLENLAKAAKASGQSAKEVLEQMNKSMTQVNEQELQKKIDELK